MRTYTRPGLAGAALELLGKLGVTEAIVVGWSLGRHIAIEMVPRFPGMRGLMIAGTPPVGSNNMAQGFRGSPHMGVAGKQDLSEADIEGFIRAIFGESVEPFIRHAVALRTAVFVRGSLRPHAPEKALTSASLWKAVPSRSR
jgi:pimeloyl-ACP methyl ester carboxylesterase